MKITSFLCLALIASLSGCCSLSSYSQNLKYKKECRFYCKGQDINKDQVKLPDGKIISVAEYNRKVDELAQQGSALNLKMAEERQASADTWGRCLLLLCTLGAAGAQSYANAAPNYPIASPLIQHAPPTTATTYIGGGPQYGGYTGTTIYH